MVPAPTAMGTTTMGITITGPTEGSIGTGANLVRFWFALTVDPARGGIKRGWFPVPLRAGPPEG
jgi:hypothetical protein